MKATKELEKIYVVKEKEIIASTGKQILNTKEVADYLKIDEKAIKKMIKKNNVPTMEVGKDLSITAMTLGIILVNPSHFISEQTMEESTNQRYNSSHNNEVEEEKVIQGKGSVYPISDRDSGEIVKYGCAYYVKDNTSTGSRRKVVTYKTREEAEEHLKSLMDMAENSKQTVKAANAVVNSGKTVETLIAEYIDIKGQNIARNTYNSYINSSIHINEQFGDRDIASVTTEEINKFIIEAKNRLNGNKLSQKSKKEIFLLMKSAYLFAEEMRYIDRSPFISSLKPYGRRKKNNMNDMFLTKKEVIKLLDFVSDNMRYKTIITVLVNSGLRIGELLALTKDDLHKIGKNTCYIDVNKSLKVNSDDPDYDDRTKSQASNRKVYISPEIMDVIDGWMGYVENNEKLWKKVVANGCENMVFVNENGNVIKYQTIRRKFDEYMKRKGWDGKHIHFHLMRHTYGSLLNESTKNLLLVSRNMGHSDINTTANYYLAVADEVSSDPSNLLCIKNESEDKNN